MFRLAGPLRAALLVVLVMAGSTPAVAQDARASRERAALRQLQQMVQQMRQENDTLAASLAAAELDKQALERERKQLAGAVQQARGRERQEQAQAQAQQEQWQARHDGVARELQTMTADRNGLQARKDALERELAAARLSQGRVEDSLARAQQSLARADADLKQAASAQIRRDAGLAQCEDKNQMLYRHGRDLLGQCQDRSATDTVLRLEPFTGIRQVAIENLLQEYRDKLDAQKLPPRAP